MDLSRFRLPVLWTASVLGILLIIHLIWVYIYEGGSPIWVPGGSISIGLVGNTPDIPNPLSFGKNKQTDLILWFLFRGLLEYNDSKWSYEWDIANCDISNLSDISCTIKKEWVWSDGTKIQIDDVIATLQAFKANPPSEKMKAFLRNVTVISPSEGVIQISSKEKNSLMLDLLSYPIIRSDMLERIRTGRLASEGYITSGSYTFLGKEKNSEYWYDRITIQKSEKNPGIGWLDKYNFLFFPDIVSLERSADNLGIIIPPVGQEKILLGPRFWPYEYAMYEYIGAFLNTNTLPLDIRSHLLIQMRSGLAGSVMANERPIKNLFSESTWSLRIEKNLADILRNRGYIKPNEKLSTLDKENGILTWSSIVYQDNAFVDLPTKKNTYFTEVADGTILISGKVPTGIKNIYINDYLLKEYRPGNNRFSYKVGFDEKSLKEGKNTYIVSFEKENEEKSIVDTITIYYSRDSGALKGLQKSVEESLLMALNTGSLLSGRMEKIAIRKKALQELDQRYYYNDSLKVFDIRLNYITEPPSLGQYATSISSTLTNLGIKVISTPIEAKSLSEMLKKWEKNYDILIVGFEANGRFSRIGQIFLSNEAKNGINFAKIESKILDGLFATLRISYTQEKTKETQQKIQEFIEANAFFLPISSPLHTLYIDKNLKGIKNIETFLDVTSLYSMIREASIKQNYVLSLDQKSFFGFITWMWENMWK